MTRFRGGERRLARALLPSGLLLVGCVASACSAKHDPAPGALMLAIETDLRVAGDIDTIGIAISDADGSHVSEDKIFPLASAGTAKFPATLAIVRGTSAPIKIRVVGYQNGSPISLRDTITTIPADRTALLPVNIDWLDQGSVSAATSTSVSSLTSLLCPSGQTSTGGGCGSFQLDSLTLSTLDTSTDLVPSDGPECFDVLSCFEGGGSTTLPVPAASDCSIAVPAAASGQNVNIGLNVAPGHIGWCSGSGCIVPIENDPTYGWTVTPAGRLQLPPGACTNPLVQSISVLVSGCDTYSPAHPVCQVYGSDEAGTPDATVTPQDGGDAAAAPDGALDAAMEASAPDLPETYHAAQQVFDFAVSDTRVFVLEQDSNGNIYVQVFPRGVPAGGSSSVPLTSGAGPAVGVTQMAATGTLLGLSGSSGGGLTRQILAIADDGTQTILANATQAGRAAPNTGLGIEGLADGGARLYVTGGTGARFCWLEIGGALACTTATDPLVATAALNPADGKYGLYTSTTVAGAGTVIALQYAAFDPAAFDGGAFSGATTLETTPPASIYAIGFPTPTTVAWLDSAGSVSTLATTATSGTGTVLTDAAAPSHAPLAAGQGYLAWIDTGGQIRATSFAAGQATAVRAIADAGVSRVLISGADLFWTDGVNSIYSNPLSSLPAAPP